MRNLHTIHLISDLTNYSGSEWRLFELYGLLSPLTKVRVWTEYRPDRRWLGRLPIERISLPRMRFPKGGTLVFVGMAYWVGQWIRLAFPNRTILICNGLEKHDPGRFKDRVAQLAIGGRRNVETVFAASWLREALGGAGPVQPSLIDLDRFHPANRPRDGQPFTIGRISRDLRKKHHPADPALYRRLAATGFRIRLMGGTVLADELAGTPGVELMPVGAQDAADFLAGLDCFFYRTDNDFVEPHGRVVTEAMAVGLPIICHEAGGYREFLEDRFNALFFSDNDEVCALIDTLRADVGLAQRLGRAARATAERMFGLEAREEVARFYVSACQTVTPSAPWPARQTHCNANVPSNAR